MAQILSGAPAAEALTAGLTVRSRELRERGITPTLVILRVGAQEESRSYERAAKKACTAAGVEAFTIELPENAHMDAVLHAVRSINAEPGVHGALLLRPIPFKKTERAACAELAAAKDVDGVSPASLAGVFTGSGGGFAPCTARAVLELLDYYGIDPAGKRVAVVGRSLVVGRPLAMLLMARDATVTLCHSRTRDLPGVCRGADIVVAAAGHAGLLGADCFAPGQVVVDVGTNVTPEGLRGDVDFAAAEGIAAAVSPVPGGVGRVTTAVLALHTIEAAERANI